VGIVGAEVASEAAGAIVEVQVAAEVALRGAHTIIDARQPAEIAVATIGPAAIGVLRAIIVRQRAEDRARGGRTSHGLRNGYGLGDRVATRWITIEVCVAVWVTVAVAETVWMTVVVFVTVTPD